MTDLHSPMILHHHSPIHVVVPLRPGADLDLVRAKLSGAFAQHDHPVVWHIPRERGDIVQLADHAAEAARDNAGLLVAAGGDGTINAVAAAALRAGVPMGVVPMGTFNYFSREQGLDLDAEAAVLQLLEALRAGELRPVQVGFVNDRVFLVNASVGLYPRLLAEREQATRKLGRSRAVAMAAAVWSMLRPSARRRWRVVVRARQGTEMQEQEHEVPRCLWATTPCNWNRWVWHKPNRWRRAGCWPWCCSNPKAVGPWLARYGAPPPASWRTTRLCKAWPVPS